VEAISPIVYRLFYIFLYGQLIPQIQLVPQIMKAKGRHSMVVSLVENLVDLDSSGLTPAQWDLQSDKASSNNEICCQNIFSISSHKATRDF